MKMQQMERRLSKLSAELVADIKAKSKWFPLRPSLGPQIDHSAPLTVSGYLAAQLRGELPIGMGRLGACAFGSQFTGGNGR